MLTFESRSIGRFVTGWDVAPTVNDTPIQLSRYPLVDSAWAHSDIGSGEMVLRYGDEIYESWFNQSSTSSIRQRGQNGKNKHRQPLDT